MTSRTNTTAKKSTLGVQKPLAKPKSRLPRKAGRPKGSLNKSTLVAHAVRDGLEQSLLAKGEKILEAVMDQAIDGCRVSQKMVMDRLMPVIKASDGETKGGAPTINISIGRAEDTPEVKRIQGEVIDGD